MSTVRRSRLPLAVVGLLGLGGCAHRAPSVDGPGAAPLQEYRGHHTAGPGSSWFRPCGASAADPAWWVTVTERAVAQLDSAQRAGRLTDGRPTYVHWRAVPARGLDVDVRRVRPGVGEPGGEGAHGSPPCVTARLLRVSR